MATGNKQKIGWIGMGRMGFPMAERLLKAGYQVSIWNRTRAKAEPLAAAGGKIVDKAIQGGVERMVKAGDTIFIPPGVPHGFKNATGIAYLNIHFGGLD